jgi:hypothetical protein
MGAEPAGYCYSTSRPQMIGLRNIGLSLCKGALYPAQGIRPCRTASSIVTVASASDRPCFLKAVESARPAAPPRPAPLGLAANSCCSFIRSDRSRSLLASRAWAPGPSRGALGRSGGAANTVPSRFPEGRADRAPYNTGLKRTRTRGCLDRLSFTALHLSFYRPRAA